MTPSPTLEELRVTADQATARFNEAQRRLTAAANEVTEASKAHHDAIVAMVTAPPAAPAATTGKARAASVSAASPISLIESTAAVLAKALVDYEQVRRDLGLI